MRADCSPAREGGVPVPLEQAEDRRTLAETLCGVPVPHRTGRAIRTQRRRRQHPSPRYAARVWAVRLVATTETDSRRADDGQMLIVCGL